MATSILSSEESPFSSKKLKRQYCLYADTLLWLRSILSVFPLLALLTFIYVVVHSLYWSHSPCCYTIARCPNFLSIVEPRQKIKSVTGHYEDLVITMLIWLSNGNFKIFRPFKICCWHASLFSKMLLPAAEDTNLDISPAILFAFFTLTSHSILSILRFNFWFR